MLRKIVAAAATALMLTVAVAGTALAQGATDCQPEEGRSTGAVASQFGGLGQFAKPVATSDPGLVGELSRAALFACP